MNVKREHAQLLLKKLETKINIVTVATVCHQFNSTVPMSQLLCGLFAVETEGLILNIVQVDGSFILCTRWFFFV